MADDYIRPSYQWVGSIATPNPQLRSINLGRCSMCSALVLDDPDSIVKHTDMHTDIQELQKGVLSLHSSAQALMRQHLEEHAREHLAPPHSHSLLAHTHGVYDRREKLVET